MTIFDVKQMCSCQVAVPEGASKEQARVEATTRFNEITQQLSALSTNFSNNALDSTAAFKYLVTHKADMAGLPDSFLAQSSQKVRRSFRPLLICMSH